MLRGVNPFVQGHTANLVMDLGSKTQWAVRGDIRAYDVFPQVKGRWAGKQVLEAVN